MSTLLKLPITPSSPFPVEEVRADFPVLGQTVHGKPLVYLDNAASTQKPQTVIDTQTDLYSTYYANIHRGVHALSERSTAAYEAVRTKVQRFIHARHPEEIVFVRGTTEGINLVAQTFGQMRVQAGDEILLSAMEHHANIVPWQMLCAQKGATLRVIPIHDSGALDLEAYENLLTERTRLVALVHISNALGTINPVRQLIAMAHKRDIPVLIDGAQAISHLPVDVQELDCDFYVFSGHKLYAPTGTGVLYGKAELLQAMPPYQGGGDMIRTVSFAKTEYAPPPAKFEAGTPDIAGVIGLGAALDYLQNLGLESIARYEAGLLHYATKALSDIPGIRLIGTAPEKASILSFVLAGVHPHDVGTILDRAGIAIRVGHHCAQPLMERFGVPATARASLAFYNTPQEIDALVRALHYVQEVFG
ncbi:cysteine desulfurase [Anthocerotibacter panamensis]|uniref:cysteine desulfurase n=1 Tax=Anthocerotibacter panamensis TaxID=2857077 RepID=UPI001C404EE1|nr:cysteine desulfurase [Anthocerotibacter panamensis]